MVAWFALITALLLANFAGSVVSPNEWDAPMLFGYRLVFYGAGVIAVVWMGARTPKWALHLLVALTVALTCLAIALRTSVPTAAVPLTTLMLAALYAATWFSKRDAMAHIGLLTVLSGVAVLAGIDSAGLRVLWGPLSSCAGASAISCTRSSASSTGR